MASYKREREPRPWAAKSKMDPQADQVVFRHYGQAVRQSVSQSVSRAGGRAGGVQAGGRTPDQTECRQLCLLLVPKVW